MIQLNTKRVVTEANIIKLKHIQSQVCQKFSGSLVSEGLGLFWVKGVYPEQQHHIYPSVGSRHWWWLPMTMEMMLNDEVGEPVGGYGGVSNALQGRTRAAESN